MNIDWDQYFMSLVYMTAMKSRDPRTKIGAVIVTPNRSTNIIPTGNAIISTGYNGLPRGVTYEPKAYYERQRGLETRDQDNEPKETFNDRLVSPEKYHWFEHAERNAIYNAARVGVPLEGCIMYTQGTPCADCGRGIIQSGIKKVIVHSDWEVDNAAKWAESAKRTALMFRESLIELDVYQGKIISELVGMHDGNLVTFGD